MQPIRDWANVKPVGGGSTQLPAGGYVCRIMGAKTEPNKYGNEMLVVIVDVSEGDKAGFFQQKYSMSGSNKWPNQATIRFNLPNEANDAPEIYDRKAGRVKKFIQDIEQSNDSYVFKWDERTLKGKYVGGLFGREEFQTTNGDRAWSTKLFYTCPAGAIRSGDFETPKDRPFDSNRGYAAGQQGQPQGYQAPPPYTGQQQGMDPADFVPYEDDDSLPF